MHVTMGFIRFKFHMDAVYQVNCNLNNVEKYKSRNIVLSRKLVSQIGDKQGSEVTKYGIS